MSSPGLTGKVPAATARREGRGAAAATAAASTVNRRVAAVRAFFEYLVMTGARTDNPVPSPRRGQGTPPGGPRPARPSGAGASAGGGTAGAPAPAAAGVAARRGGRCVRGVAAHAPGPGHGAGDAAGRAALSGGPRPAACDVDMGRRRLRVIGKGGKERHVPVDRAFFAELAAYLRLERPPGLATAGVLRGAARPDRRGSPSPRRACAACSAGTGRRRERPGSARTGSRHTYGTELKVSGVASAASFGSLRERRGPGLRGRRLAGGAGAWAGRHAA